ncbi:MAG: efflux RND transporter periplasmic adaptor subunit [Wenzhouxiangella sp.]|nr:MAG: efflux RND transporter periplasmic adaptor subunit [Wenzhouxiangella sp.]
MKYPALFLLLSSLLLAGCHSPEEPGTAPLVGVGVYEIRPTEINRSWRFSARTRPAETVQVQARVPAEVAAVAFERGARVEAGDVLFRLDDRTQRDQLRQAEAQLASRSSALELAERNLARGLEVADRGFLSAADIDRLRDAQAQARGAFEAAEADLEQARQNLDYTVIRAPIAGRVGDTTATAGNLVGPGSGPLVRLQATDPILARFQLTDREFQQLLQQRPLGLDSGLFEIGLLLEGDRRHPWAGTLDFVDIEVDDRTGTAEITVRFPNPDDTLAAGLFVTVELETRETESRLLVPNQAIGRNQLGSFVMVVGPDQTVSERSITLERQLRTSAVLEAGLVAGERIIVEGLQKARPGSRVQSIAYDWDQASGLLAPAELLQP